MTKIKLSKTKKIIISALMLAAFIVLDRFITINTQLLVINFSCVAIMLVAIYCGPKYSCVVAALGDLIGALIFPFGAYFPGFTISNAILGYIYGILLYRNPQKQKKEKVFIFKVILSNLINLVLVNTILNTYFIHVMYHKAFIPLMLSRITAQFILFPLNIIIIIALDKILEKSVNKYLFEEEQVGIEEYLYGFEKVSKKPTTEAMVWLMNEFGNPHKKLKVVHIAGTNGKGSVCEMLSNVLIKSGYKVGKFISPYLVHFNDGIQINNQEISDEDAREIMEELSVKIKEYNKTHDSQVKWFEVITSLVFIYFERKKCDIVVLETGLGGTYDCTNIVEPLVSIITKIGYDHMDILGKTIEEITKNKAGIIKKNSDAIFVEQEECINLIEETCKINKTKLHRINEKEIINYDYNGEFQKFDYKENTHVEINLKGKTQTYNSCEVIECIEILRKKGFEISEEALREGLKTVVHRARLEKIYEKPTVIYDGGHNESAIKNLKENLKQYYKDDKKVFIISILKTKDYKTVIKEICKEENSIFFFTTGNDKKKYVSKNKLYGEAKKYLNDVNIFKEEFKDALDIAKKVYKERIVFVIGSFYVYKDAIEFFKIEGRND